MVSGLMDSIQVWCDVSYFTVTLNSQVLKSYLLSLHFVFSIEYTKNNLRNFIQILHVHVTGHR